MENKILKKNKNNGFVLLYTMIVSSIILAVALGISSVALKEAKFSTSAKATNEAFFAADTGAECALFFDKTDPAKNAFTGTATMNCANHNITLSLSGNPWSFTVNNLGSSGSAYADVILTKDTSTPIPTTTIISKGYNNSSNNKVERVLEVNY